MCRRDGLAHGSALSGLRFTYSGGSPLNPTLKNAVEKLFGQPLHNGYGLTESSPTISHTRLDTPRTDTSVTQSAVVGRLVADGNEEVVAFVELDPQPVIDNRSVAGIPNMLSPYKCPSEIIIMPSLPSAATGKVLKGQLKKLHNRCSINRKVEF